VTDHPTARRQVHAQAAGSATDGEFDPRPRAASGPENPQWGCRRVDGELLVLGVNVAASTVWEILKDAGVDPAPECAAGTWASFLRSGTSVTCSTLCASSNASTTSIGRTRASQAPGHCISLPPPITGPVQIAQLNIRGRQRLGESSTSTNMPPDLHRLSFRQAQGYQPWTMSGVLVR
jgi:hypothetical protein